MADLFLSYQRVDEPAARRIVGALRGAGVSVWWDQDIAPDAPWEGRRDTAHAGEGVGLL